MRKRWGLGIRPLVFLLLLSAVRSSLESRVVLSSKYEDSKIWPAPLVELYERSNPALLRTFNAKTWKLEFDNAATGEIRNLVGLATQRFCDFLVAGAPSSDAPINPSHAVVSELAGIWLTVTDTNDVTLRHGMDESYRIHIPYPDSLVDSWIELEAQTIYGALHGLETIKQLLEPGWMLQEGAASIFVVRDTPLYIQDEPEFAYRGLMIDTARHYLPLEMIQHNLNVMNAHKLNVLHWHLTDTQSWPYQSEKFPELTQAAYCPSCIYTTEQIQSVLAEAAVRGIRVIVEVDLPGHSQAIGVSHPEYLSPCGDDDPRRSEPLDVTEPAVYDFVHQLYSELTRLFPDDWIHLGGDEVSLSCWQNSTKIQDWMIAHNLTSEVELLQYFELDLIDTVGKKLDKRVIVWQDLFDSGVELPISTVLDVWKEWILAGSLYNATSAGYDVIVSACWYLDHQNERWWDFYRCNAMDKANLTQDQREHVLGGHASMWGERVDATNFYERVWPRASAVSEVLWSGNAHNYSDLSYSLVQGRLERFRCWLVRQFQIPASPIAPGYCGDGPIASSVTTTRS